MNSFKKIKNWLVGFCLFMGFVIHAVFAADNLTVFPVQACMIVPASYFDSLAREQLARCLQWQESPDAGLCQGYYKDFPYTMLPETDQIIALDARHASLSATDKSVFSGGVSLRQANRVVSASTAYIYRDALSHEINRIELLGGVRIEEPGKMFVGRYADLHPQDKSGKFVDVMYRFKTDHAFAELPAVGRARLITRFANEDVWLDQATYSTCRPKDKTWTLKAAQIRLNHETHTGVARDAIFYFHDLPIFYWPYMKFPTSRERQSGFLFPTKGYSNVGGFDLALPYYLNLAPNVDATITPHLYTRRGLMMDGEFRYLTEQSIGMMHANILEHDKAYRNFLNENASEFPQLAGKSDRRWELQWVDSTRLMPDLQFHLNYQQVSDDYYLQDFTTNLAILSERQLQRQADLVYSTVHWVFNAMLQGYQTLEPVNQLPIAPAYERLPQLSASGFYDNLPLNTEFSMLAQYDQFRWPSQYIRAPDGPRFYVDPEVNRPFRNTWGYVTPGAGFVARDYQINRTPFFHQQQFSSVISRYHVDAGLFFERDATAFGHAFRQTLEPRLFYLYTPYENQSEIPLYDSGNMIFNVDQLFRLNRFSGFDRIGDANQLAFAIKSRWLSSESGIERAQLSVGQLVYFSNRRVELCQSPFGYCVENPLNIGYLSPNASTSPIASRFIYFMNSLWALTSDYVWDPHAHDTNNAHMDIRYHNEDNRLFSLGYTWLKNGDVTQVFDTRPDINALHQITLAYAWPFNDAWRTLGVYSYNISKKYDMTTLLGVEYSSCCWAVRLMGGRTLQNLDNQLQPNYNNSVYLQILWKGLGALGNNSPATTIQTWLPNYVDSFH